MSSPGTAGRDLRLDTHTGVVMSMDLEFDRSMLGKEHHKGPFLLQAT